MQSSGVAFYDDLVWLASGRMEITLSFTSVDVPFNAKLRKALTGKVAARLEAAVGKAA